jgi:TonB family protein
MWISLRNKSFSFVCLIVRSIVLGLAGALIVAALVSPLVCASAGQDAGPALPPSVRDKFDALAARVAAQIRLSKIDPALTQFFVFDFSNSGDNQFSKLGAVLADRFSESLARQANGFVVSDRKLLTAYLKENCIDLKDVQGESIALALVRSMGAAGVIQGEVQEDPDHQLLLTIRMEGFGSVWSAGALLPLTDEMRTLFNEQLPPFTRPSSVPDEPGVLTVGQNGAGVPECVYCPPPLSSDVARAAKYQGTIILSVVVTPDGRAVSISVLKGAPFQLNKQAIEAVQGWKFKPAEKNGKPVPVRVPVEISFRFN